MTDFQMTGWFIFLLLAVTFVVICNLGDHDRIDDQRYVAKQRQLWKEGKPYRRSPATRFLDFLHKWF